MFKVNRSLVIKALVDLDVPLRIVAERARISTDDLAATHLSGGKAVRLAMVLGLPVRDIVYRMPKEMAGNLIVRYA